MLSPAFDDDLSLPQRVEDLPVQQLVAEPGIEALNIAILPRTAWFDEGGLRADSPDPGSDVFRNELGTIVAADKRR